MSATAPRVLFIVGAGRSGSTLIDQVVGEATGYCSVGELNALWLAGLIQREPCGCGAPLPECPFWKEVLLRAFGAHEPVQPVRVAALVDKYVRIRPSALYLMLKAQWGGHAESPSRYYASLLSRLYRAAASVSRADVVIDSSKVPAHALALSAFGDVDLYVLHVVRDPRAVAYAWLRNADAGNRERLGAVPFRSMGFMSSIGQWVFRSAAIETLLRPRLGRRYMQITYEAFAADPAGVTGDIESFVGKQTGREQFVAANAVRLGENHIVAGNRSKHHRGVIRITPDNEWSWAMPGAKQLQCALLTWPFLARYHYPLHVTRR